MLYDPNLFTAYMDEVGFRSTFWGSHYDRYVETGRAIATVDFAHERKEVGLELGTSWIFPSFLTKHGIIKSFDVTSFDAQAGQKIGQRVSQFESSQVFRTFNVNLEADELPVPDGHYDLVLCFELVEHLDVDPMFMMAEINRCLRLGGRLVMSTPNSVSSQIVERVLHGYAPQFYMYYQRDRSPFRHNFEYAPHQVRQLFAAAGFQIDSLWTSNTFAPESEAGMRLLREKGFPTDERGDNIFVVARKAGPVVDRYPDQIYDTHF